MSLRTLVSSFVDPLVVDQSKLAKESPQSNEENDDAQETIDLCNTISIREVIPTETIEDGSNGKRCRVKKNKKNKKAQKTSTIEADVSDSMKSTSKHTPKKLR